MKDLFSLLNPVQNEALLSEIETELMTKRLYTIRLGQREYATTNSREAFLFSHAFGNRAGFHMDSKPYSGSEINSVVTTKQ